MKRFCIKVLLITALVLMSDVRCVTSDVHVKAESILYEIRSCLEKAIQDCGLGEKLELTSIFSACDTLHVLRKSAVDLHIKNEKITSDIIQCINERLMHNPALIKFIKNLNASLKSYQQLSNNEVAVMLKNGSLLVPIHEIYALAEVLRIVQGLDKLALSSQRLNALLKEVELNKDKCALQLWHKKRYLREYYEYLQYHAPTLFEKIKYTKKSARAQKVIETIIAALGITDEYVHELKRLELFTLQQPQQKLYDLFEDAFDGHTEGLSIKAYALSIEKSKRAEGW
jgi:hypothetical protein